MSNKGRKPLKTILLITLIVSLAGATSALAYRGWGGGHMGMGMGMGKHWWARNLTPEQAGQVFDLRQKFMNDTAELRKNMMIKRAELAQLWKAEQPNEEAILAKVKELSALKAQFMEKAVAQRLAMRKIAPQAMGPCPGFGPGMGPGFGPGPGKGKGGGQSMNLDPGSNDVAGYDAALTPELAFNME
jgi:zinc resistance-associated protein